MALPGPRPSAETADSLLEAGVDHFLNGRMREAATAFQKALALDPTNDQAQSYLRSMLGPSASEGAGPRSRPATTQREERPVPKPTLKADLRSPPAPPAAPRMPDPKPVSKPRPPAHAQIIQFLQEARAAAELGDFTGAVDYCDQLLAVDPTSREAKALREVAANTLVQMYESQLGGRNGIPEVIADPGEIIWLSLDNRAGFVLAQIDGQVSYDDLYAICGMSPLDTSRILAQLLEQKVIRTRLGPPGYRR